MRSKLFNLVELESGKMYNHVTTTVTLSDEPTIGESMYAWDAVTEEICVTTANILSIEGKLIIDVEGNQYLLTDLNKDNQVLN